MNWINKYQSSGAGVYVSTEVSGPAVNGYHSHAIRHHKREEVTLPIKTYLSDLRPDRDDADIEGGTTQFILPYVPPQNIIFD